MSFSSYKELKNDQKAKNVLPTLRDSHLQSMADTASKLIFPFMTK